MKEHKACLWYSFSTDVTGKALAEQLGIEHGYGVKKGSDFVIVFGGNTKRKDGTTRAYPEDAFYINHPKSVEENRNKFNALAKMQRNGVKVPLHWSSAEIKKALVSGKAAYPLVGRTNKHQGGSGFFFCVCNRDLDRALSEGATHFMQYVQNDREYRIHVFDNEVIKIMEKVQDSDDADPMIRSNHRGWKFVRKEKAPDEVLAQAKKALEAMNLDFGAVDIIVADNKSVHVIEVNTGPSLVNNDKTLDIYVDRFKTLLDKVIKPKPTLPPKPTRVGLMDRFKKTFSAGG